MGDQAESEIVIGKVYITAARNLGDSILTKIDVRLDVTAHDSVPAGQQGGSTITCK